MILRSPAENENGVISFHMALSSTRHSRARGNPGSLRRINLDTRVRGYDGTQAGLFVLIPKRVFSKEDTKSTKFKIKISETFVSFVIFVVRSLFCLLHTFFFWAKISSAILSNSPRSPISAWRRYDSGHSPHDTPNQGSRGLSGGSSSSSQISLPRSM